MKSKYNYDWTLANANFTKNKGKVFSCFACGGGSTMGYKLAGFDVLGYNEIDSRMSSMYDKNHAPKFKFTEPIQTFKLRKDLPKELYELDILDGSPPCSSFSMSGTREKDWGKLRVFKEGQALQVLDTLFFDFIDLAKELQPKIVVAENVKGLLQGNARKYVKRIMKEFDEAGYFIQYHLLNSSCMGVPQRRERVFFLAVRKDLLNDICSFYDLSEYGYAPEINLNFNYDEINFSEINDTSDIVECKSKEYRYWIQCEQGKSFASVHEKKHLFNRFRCGLIRPLPTFTAGSSNDLYHPTIFRRLNKNEIIKAQTFPSDYDFMKNNVGYVCGMSVPPIMIANLADRIYEQWLSKI